MSFLDALASDGLSVGLRFYNAKMNTRPAGDASLAPVGALISSEDQPEAAVRLSGRSPQPPAKAAPVPKTPEELAAGRAEATALLAAEGSLGSLQAARPAKAAVPTDKGAETDRSRELSEEEKDQVEKLKQRDREVHAHEQAHVNAAGGLAGAPVYKYQAGPDGRRYAVGGHVEVHANGSSNPEQALREAEAVKRAATAPAEPSGPDQAAAAQASAEINRIKAEKVADQSNGSPLGQKVAGAYSAVKLGGAYSAIRPVLARV